jgi:hypothetical protein
MLIALQHVDAAETLLKLRRLIGIVFGHRGRHHFPHGDAHAFGYGGGRAQNFA